MLESNRRVGIRSASFTNPPTSLNWYGIAAFLAALLMAGLPAPASACTDDKDCKGDRICDHSVCKTPRGSPVEPPSQIAAVPLTPPAPQPPAQMVIVEPAPASAAGTPPEATPGPLTPPPLVMIEPAPPAPPTPESPPVAIVHATAEPPPSSDGSYAPAAGFRCLLGEPACAFQLRPLEINWTHVDLHGDVLLGGLTGGDLGIGAGTRHWQLGGSASPYGMVVRWDNDLAVVSNSPSGVTLLTLGLDTGPRVGFSFAVSRDLALELTLNGGLFLGYGVPTSGGANEWTLAGYTGLLFGARM